MTIYSAISYFNDALNIGVSGYFVTGLAVNSLNRPCASSNPQLNQVIQEQYKDILDHENRSIQVSEKFDIGIASTYGERCLPTSTPRVNILPYLRENDPDAYGFLLQHQISFLNTHTNFYKFLSSSLLSVPGTIFQFLGDYYPILGNLAQLTGLVAYQALSYYGHVAANHFTIEQCTVEQLKGGLCYYLAQREKFIERRIESYCNRLLSRPNGDHLFSFNQPLHSTSTYKLIKALHQRGIAVVTKQDHLKDIHLNETMGSLLENPHDETFNLDDDSAKERIAQIKQVLEENEKAIKNTWLGKFIIPTP